MSLLYKDFVKSLNNVERFVVKVGTSSITDNNNKLDVGKIVSLRENLLRQEGSIGVRMSYVDIMVFIIARALKAHPFINCS